MELKEFVSGTLVEIIEGVKEAQSKTMDRAKHGTYVNPGCQGANSTRPIEFDVAVTAVEGQKTKGGVGIFVGPVGLGSHGQSEVQNTSLSRIKFTVPIVLPIGKIPALHE